MAHPVADLTYPRYVQGNARWPAMRVAASALPETDWRGWDYLRLNVLNPEDEVVDLGIWQNALRHR